MSALRFAALTVDDVMEAARELERAAINYSHEPRDKYVKDALDGFPGAAGAIESLAAEVARLKEDAERWQHVRTAAFLSAPTPVVVEAKMRDGVFIEYVLLVGDAADAARKAKP